MNGELILHYTDGTSDKLAVTNRDNNYFSYCKTTVNGVTGYAIALTDQYLHSVEAIEIPESYNGLPVIQLGYFYEKVGYYSNYSNSCNVPCGFQSYSLKSIIIPESIMYIYSRAFYVSGGTSALESAVFAHPTGWVKTGGYGTGGAVQEGVLSDPAAANALAKTDHTFYFERTDY